jgi:hypothetical protein
VAPPGPVLKVVGAAVLGEVLEVDLQPHSRGKPDLPGARPDTRWPSSGSSRRCRAKRDLARSDTVMRPRERQSVEVGTPHTRCNSMSDSCVRGEGIRIVHESAAASGASRLPAAGAALSAPRSACAPSLR